MFAKSYFGSAEWAAAVHGVLLSEAAEAGLAEDVAARVHLERLVQEIETDRAEEILQII